MEHKVFHVTDYWATALVASLLGKKVNRGDTILVPTDTVFKPTLLVPEWEDTIFLRRLRACGYTHVEYRMLGHAMTGWRSYWANWAEEKCRNDSHVR